MGMIQNNFIKNINLSDNLIYRTFLPNLNDFLYSNIKYKPFKANFNTKNILMFKITSTLAVVKLLHKNKHIVHYITYILKRLHVLTFFALMFYNIKILYNLILYKKKY